MNPRRILNQVVRNTKRNSPTLLSGAAVTGVLSTAYFSGKASWDAAHVLGRKDPAAVLDKKESFKLVWKLYIPAAASGAVTIVCIVAGTRIGIKRSVAAYSLLAASERAFVEYRDKVTEQLGERKEQAIRDSIAQDRVHNNPPVLVIGTGSVLCMETHSGRYFMSDMETLRSSVNTINEKLNKHDEATLDDLYYLIGLQPTDTSARSGWDSNKALELQYSTALTDDKRPCITFTYNYLIPF